MGEFAAGPAECFCPVHFFSGAPSRVGLLVVPDWGRLALNIHAAHRGSSGTTDSVSNLSWRERPARWPKGRLIRRLLGKGAVEIRSHPIPIAKEFIEDCHAADLLRWGYPL